MHELTLHELDAELAEQLPTRELMAFIYYSPTYVRQSATAVALAGNQVAGGGRGTRLLSLGNVATAVALNINL